MRWVVALMLLIATAASAAPELREFQTPYYTIHTDLPLDDVREAALRMTRMAEEYARRTEGFAGRVQKRMPFYLFSKVEDYHAAGGIPGSGGLFNGQRLMAVAGGRNHSRTWQVVQHEGFHQFSRATIGHTLPIWVEEGLAEYFGHAIFTGDGYVSGVIPSSRLARVKQSIEAGRFRGIEPMMLLTHKEWNSEISQVNYDQGWSMIQFLAHGDDGRYQPALVQFLSDISHRRGWIEAWVAHFGRDIAGFEKRWKEYWLSLPSEPTADLYARGTCATLASFLARAASQRQVFSSFEEFCSAAEAGQLKHHPEDWLPPALLAEALRAAARAEWGLEQKGTRLVCKVNEKTAWQGTFIIQAGRVGSVSVTKHVPPAVTRPKAEPPTTTAAPARPAPPARKADPVASAISLAQAYASAGDIDRARSILQRAIDENPDAPEIDKARSMLQNLK